MKYKVGDKVRIKSLDWYYKNKGKPRCVTFAYAAEVVFTEEMSSFCGQIVTISKTGYTQDIGFYRIGEDNNVHMWTDEMIEGLVEPIDCKKCGLTRMSTRCLFMDNCPYNQPKNTIEIPKDWVLKDENGNIINTTKIVLEKKEKEYPKTYKECAKIMNCPIAGPSGWLFTFDANIKDSYYRKIDILMGKFTRLLICRDAYWKLAGDEMGLEKPWEPDWNNDEIVKYCIIVDSGFISQQNFRNTQFTFAFPTEEMRDAFYENFKELIESCKELL